MEIFKLAFYTRYHYALDEEFLCEEEKQHGRDEHQHRSRHQQMALFGEDRVERLQAQCHRPMAFTLQVDQWRVEIIPRVEHAEDGHRSDDRIGLWQDHIP